MSSSQTSKKILRYKIPSHLILTALNDVGEMNITDLIRRTHLSRQTIYNKVKDLENLQLVVERKQLGLPTKRYISLTDLGKNAANVIKAITNNENENKQKLK